MILTKREKVVLRWIRDDYNGEPPYAREIMDAVTVSLADKGLIKRTATKDGTGGILMPKGYLLFADNPKLRNRPSSEIVRWIIATTITTVAAVASIISCLK